MTVGGGGVAGGKGRIMNVDGSAETTAPSPAKPGQAGFGVLVTARMLCGKGNEEQAQAGAFRQEYFQRLREAGSQPGLGFYIPDDDPKEKKPEKSAIYSPLPPKLVTPAAGSGPSGGKGGAGGAVAVAGPSGGGAPGQPAGNLDPITGESLDTDWVFEFGFKVKIGEKPKPPAVPDNKGGEKQPKP